MLVDFEKWFLDNEENLRARGLIVELTRPLATTDNPAVYAGIDSRLHMARITVWESGFCDTEILNIETGHQVSWNHAELASKQEAELASKQELERLLGAFCDSLVELS